MSPRRWTLVTLMRVGVLTAAIAQVVVPALVNPFADGGDAIRAGQPSGIEPAGYAFSIWGPIYALALLYSLWQLTPAGRAEPTTARLAPLAFGVYAGSSLWLLAADERLALWLTMPILAAMALAASTALVIAARAPVRSRSWTWAVVVPFALYAGWTTCATFVNFAELAPGYGFHRFGLSVPSFGALSLAAVTLVGALVLWLSRGQPAYAGTLLWGLAAVLVAVPDPGGVERPIVVAAALGILVVVSLSAALSVLRRPAAI